MVFPSRWHFANSRLSRASSVQSSVLSIHQIPSGTRKGLDISCGDGKGGRGGFLIRTIKRIGLGGETITGPCNVVDHLLGIFGAIDVAHFVDECLQNDLSALDVSSNRATHLLLLHTKSTKLLWPREYPLEVVPEGYLEQLVYASPRIGLNLASFKGDLDPSHPRLKYLTRNYRFFWQPEKLTLKRHFTFLGICNDTHTDAEHAAKLMGVSNTVCRGYAAHYNRGTSQGNPRKWIGNTAATTKDQLELIGTVQTYLAQAVKA